MTHPIRIAVLAAYSYGLLTLVGYLYPDWQSEARHEVMRLVDVQHEKALLEGKFQNLLAWRSGKKEVVEDLLAHRMNLREAASRFHELNDTHGTPSWWNDFRHRYAGESDNERHCQEVIALTHQLLENQSPAEAQSVTHRLQAEMQEQIEQGSLHSGE